MAFLISGCAVMIDFAGPWEVFQGADVVGRTQPALNLYAAHGAPLEAENFGKRSVPMRKRKEV